MERLELQVLTLQIVLNEPALSDHLQKKYSIKLETIVQPEKFRLHILKAKKIDVKIES